MEISPELSVRRGRAAVEFYKAALGAVEIDRGGSTVRLLLIVEDPRSVCEQAIALGATEVAPVEESHGWLLGRIEDPFGHHWEIGKPLTEWPPPSGPERP